MSTTGVPVGDPHQRQVAEGAWSTGLCDCFSDVSNCCMTCFCPCVTFGQIAEITDKGATSCGLGGALYTLLFCLTGLHSCYSCFYRIKMREQYNIQGSACVDCLTHYFCEGCALCQEYRELKSRGFDMSLGVGWNENMKRQNEGVPMAPVMDTGMNR